MPRPSEELRRAYQRASSRTSYGWPDPVRSWRRAVLGPRAILVVAGIIGLLAALGLFLPR